MQLIAGSAVDGIKSIEEIVEQYHSLKIEKVLILSP